PSNARLDVRIVHPAEGHVIADVNGPAEHTRAVIPQHARRSDEVADEEGKVIGGAAGRVDKRGRNLILIAGGGDHGAIAIDPTGQFGQTFLLARAYLQDGVLLVEEGASIGAIGLTRRLPGSARILGDVDPN